MVDHAAKATEYLKTALDPETEHHWVIVAAAGIHAILHIGDAIKHGLRDVVYEMGD